MWLTWTTARAPSLTGCWRMLVLHPMQHASTCTYIELPVLLDLNGNGTLYISNFCQFLYITNSCNFSISQTSVTSVNSLYFILQIPNHMSIVQIPSYNLMELYVCYGYISDMHVLYPSQCLPNLTRSDRGRRCGEAGAGPPASGAGERHHCEGTDCLHGLPAQRTPLPPQPHRHSRTLTAEPAACLS